MRLKTVVGLALPALAVLVSVCVINAEHRRPLPSNNQAQPARDADPLSGEWNVTFYVGDTATPATFKFKLEGTKVTGAVYSDHTGEGTIRDGKWLDGKLSFAADFKNHRPIVIQGTLKDGKLAGEAHHPEGPTFKWGAVKAGEDPISGEWAVTFHVREMVIPGTFTFILDGTKITGTGYSNHTGAGTIRDGKWVDGKLSLTLDFKKHESISVTSVLKDGKLAGEFTTEGFTDKWEATKK